MEKTKKISIIEGNKIIADFMELVVHTLGGRLVWYDFDGASDVEYHTRWDWLMPVVEKIQKIDSESDSAVLSKLEIEVNLSFNKISIKKTWLAVIDFVEWYNKLNQK